MFVLQLNDMRSATPEMLSSVARAETKEELESFLEDQKVESYRDGQWAKSFKKGGLLEWCNQPYDDDQTFVDMDLWRKQWWEQNIMTIQEIPK